VNSIMHIGFDDTDSLRMGCTTYIAALLVEKLEKVGLKFIDYPNLVRLNPNIPWKTRGNGAICLRVSGDAPALDEARELVLDQVERWSDLDFPGTDPGVVFFCGTEPPIEFREFAKRTLRDVVTKGEALRLVRRFRAEAIGFKGGRGVIGGLAAIGETLSEDHTYELLTYRRPENRGKDRKVDVKSVSRMERETSPFTFSNIDPETGRVLITPRGPDPVLYGVRGESAQVVRAAMGMIDVGEDVERWVIFRTNHGTDAHLRPVRSISEVKAYRPVIVRGDVTEKPWTGIGGHVYFAIHDSSGKVNCAAYEPTGSFRSVVKDLIEGDSVEVYGGVRPPSSKHSMTVNLEKIRILGLAPQVTYQNPRCSVCGRSMKSMGRGKGFRCERCKIKRRSPDRIPILFPRVVSTGLYIPPPRAHRHLTKPMVRYGQEKTGCPKGMIDGWHSP